MTPKSPIRSNVKSIQALFRISYAFLSKWINLSSRPRKIIANGDEVSILTQMMDYKSQNAPL